MGPFVSSCIAFACILGVALAAMFVKRFLPEHHLSADSKDVVKMGMGTMATLAALVLGLLIATAKGTYDAQAAEVQDLSVKVLLLDRILLKYGPKETEDARQKLKDAATAMRDRLWPAEGGRPVDLTPGEARKAGEEMYDKIAELSPAPQSAQAALKTRALEVATELLQIRLRLYARRDSSLPTPLLVVLVSWLVILFAGYGLLAPRNATVTAVLFICALSISAAIFLLLELSTPFTGILRLSDGPVQDALSQLSANAQG
jgi:hypothetical protein